MKCIVEHKMTSLLEVVVVTVNDTCAYVKQELEKRRQRTAIVINHEGLVEGVITARDLLDAGKDNLVLHWYKSPAYTITPNQPIEVARHLLRKYNNHQLIVVDSQGRPIGILWDYEAMQDC